MAYYSSPESTRLRLSWYTRAAAGQICVHQWMDDHDVVAERYLLSQDLPDGVHQNVMEEFASVETEGPVRYIGVPSAEVAADMVRILEAELASA